MPRAISFDRPQEALLPRHIGYPTLATCIAAYEQWLTDQDADLAELLDAAMRELQGGFGGHEPEGRSPDGTSVAGSRRTGHCGVTRSHWRSVDRVEAAR
jgi:hypothetical protein